jgi:hypothetical protein
MIENEQSPTIPRNHPLAGCRVSIFAGVSKDAFWLALTGAELIVQAPYTGTSIARAIVCARV